MRCCFSVLSQLDNHVFLSVTRTRSSSSSLYYYHDYTALVAPACLTMENRRFAHNSALISMHVKFFAKIFLLQVSLSLLLVIIVIFIVERSVLCAPVLLQK